ncbi:MAG: hypothetical protein IPK26_15535 [Planctomycetes bacterium]|nr:hypothetical protein [Planctomycetota bacterium]
MNDPDPTSWQGLSPAGAARRDVLRSQLLARVGWRGRRRRGAQALLLAAVMVLAWFAIAPVMPLERSPIGSVVSPSTPVASAEPTWRIVRDDPSVLSRCATTAVVSRVEFLDDRELQQQLVLSGRSGAMVRSGDRVIVLAPADSWAPVEP